jgi:hypothetical protein
LSHIGWCPTAHSEEALIKLGKYKQAIISAGLSLSLGASFGAPTQASPAGDECRKEICNGAVTACMQANLAVNPLASTQSEKKTYCDQFFAVCMIRSIMANFTWYSPETVQRFMKCPS